MVCIKCMVNARTSLLLLPIPLLIRNCFLPAAVPPRNESNTIILSAKWLDHSWILSLYCQLCLTMGCVCAFTLYSSSGLQIWKNELLLHIFNMKWKTIFTGLLATSLNNQLALLASIASWLVLLAIYPMAMKPFFLWHNLWVIPY